MRLNETIRNRRNGYGAVVGAAWISGMLLLAGTAHAQDSGTVPPSAPTSAPAGAPNSGGPGGPGPGGPQAGGPPPLPVLLGFADFMLTIERPWKAEPLYRLVLMQDPNNEVAKKGLRDAENQKKIGFTSLVHSYYDSKDVQLFAYGGGPVVHTPLGKVTITVGNGYYKNNNNKNNRRNPLSLLPTIPTAVDNFAVIKQTYNVEFQPFWGKNMQHEGSVWLSYQSYQEKSVPDRLLYDFRYSYIRKPGREKYTIGTGRHDSFYQNQVNQFLAPETFFQLQRRITFNDYYTAIEHPIGEKFDLNFTYRYFKYRDNNERNNFRTVLWYRLKPTNPMKPMPIWRVGLDGIIDEGRFFTLDYGIPRDFRSLSIATDYAMLTRDYKLVGYFSFPIAEKNFAAPIGFVGYVSKFVDKDKRFEVFGKSVILEARNLSVSLYDYVLGLNTRF